MKPKVEDIIKLKDTLYDEVYPEVRENFKEDEKFYELDFLNMLGLPKEVASDGVVLPTARDIIDTAVDHTDISNVRVDVTRQGMAKIDKEIAEMMRKYYLGLIYRTNTESPISPWRVAAKHYWLHGVCWFKTLWDADRWPDKPTQDEGESDESYRERLEEWQGTTELTVPIIIKAVNPICMMPDPNFIEPQFVIERHEKAYFAVRKNYPSWKNPEGKGVGDTVEWIEYWDEKYKCYLADGEPVLKYKVVPHGYGFIPYVQVDSGLGNLDSTGSFAKRWVGLIRYLKKAIISESRSFSIEDIILKQGAWPWYAASDDSNGAKVRQLTSLNQYYGAINDLTGIKLEKMTPDVPAQALTYHYGMTSEILAAHNPKSLRGLSQSGVRAAADRRLVQAEAAMRYMYSKDSFQYGTARALTNCAKLYKNVIPGNIRLWAYTPKVNFDEIIDREKMKEPFFCHIEFAAISPEDEYHRHDDLARQVQNLQIPVEAAWSRLNEYDVEKLKELSVKQGIETSPGLLQAKDMYISQKALLAFQQAQNAKNPDMIKQQVMQEQQMALAGRSQPVIPNNPQQGSPEQIQRQRDAQQPVISVTQGQGGGGNNYVS